MRRLVYSNEAMRDLVAIADYIDDLSGNIETGLRVTQRLRGYCLKLAGSPLMQGRSRPDLGEGLRSVPRESYVIVFKCTSARLDVVNIIHSARDIEAMFQDKGED